MVLVFLGCESGGLVHDLNSELVGSLDDLLTLLGIDVMGDYSGELLVVHQEHLNV